MECIYCGKEYFGIGKKHLCRTCKKLLPKTFVGKGDKEIYAEVRRNERAKNIFSETFRLGKISLDNTHFLFKLGNGYYSVLDLKEYSFYTKNARYESGLTQRFVTMDAWFSYKLTDGVKREVRLGRVPCRYTNNVTNIKINPPLALYELRENFELMIKGALSALERRMHEY